MLVLVLISGCTNITQIQETPFQTTNDFVKPPLNQQKPHKPPLNQEQTPPELDDTEAPEGAEDVEVEETDDGGIIAKKPWDSKPEHNTTITIGKDKEFNAEIFDFLNHKEWDFDVAGSENCEQECNDFCDDEVDDCKDDCDSAYNHACDEADIGLFHCKDFCWAVPFPWNVGCIANCVEAFEDVCNQETLDDCKDECNNSFYNHCINDCYAEC